MSPGGPLMLLGSNPLDRKSTRLNSSHSQISYAVFCLKKKTRAHTLRVTAPSTRLHASRATAAAPRLSHACLGQPAIRPARSPHSADPLRTARVPPDHR